MLISPSDCNSNIGYFYKLARTRAFLKFKLSPSKSRSHDSNNSSSKDSIKSTHPAGVRRFHTMSHPKAQSAFPGEDIDGQGCEGLCSARSFSIQPHSPDLRRRDTANHAALEALVGLPPLRRETKTDAARAEENQYQNQSMWSLLIIRRETKKRDAGEENKNQREKRHDYLALYRATLSGNWRDAKVILDKYPNAAIRDSITEMGDTVLHIASATKHATFVKEVVGLLTEKEVVGLLTAKEVLARPNKCGDTAFCIAAESGIVTIAEEMWKKNEDLVLIRNKKERTPLHAAALFGHRDMVAYLLPKTPFGKLTTEEKMDILVATITHDMYDIALEILKKDATLATADNRVLALRELARKPSAIGNRSQLSVWKRYLNSRFEGICDKALMKTLAHKLVKRLSEDVQLFEVHKIDVLLLLMIAATVGNAEFLIILIRTYPDIMWTIISRNRSLFHIAVIYRQESVFNLIHEVDALKKIMTKYEKAVNENILHLAGYLAPPSRLNIVSGAALQMQRELLWFTELEKIVLPSLLKKKNFNHLTPWDLFKKEHENLRRDGENWMKDTANYCMIVATLITTVAFAAAFTVPGGSDQVTGIAIFHRNMWFRVFFISDALALVSSSSSLLIFLSILTSRFTEMDFLKSLPSKLVWGLTALFISIVGMLAAFSATCFLVFKSEMVWVPIVIITLAGVAIILFVLLHGKLWFDIIRSTFFSSFLLRPRKKRIF